MNSSHISSTTKDSTRNHYSVLRLRSHLGGKKALVNVCEFHFGEKVAELLTEVVRVVFEGVYTEDWLVIGID
jgi:hypothetical protein